MAKRTLRYGQQVPGGSQNMTIEGCTAACKKAGYSIAGTEYSAECFCDNAPQNGGGPAPDGNAKYVRQYPGGKLLGDGLRQGLALLYCGYGFTEAIRLAWKQR